MKPLYPLATCLFLSCQSLVAQVMYPAGATGTSDTIPFELTDHNNMAIAGILNGADTATFMFHTAANDLSLIKDYTEGATTLEWADGGTVKSWGGRSQARVSPNNGLEIGRLSWDSLNVWEGERSGPGTDGKFGPNLFNGRAIEINFSRRFLVIHDSLPAGVGGYTKLPLLQEAGMLFIEGTSLVGGKGYPGKFLIHSGYGGSVLYNDQFVAETRIGDQIEITEAQELRDSYGNVLETKKGVLPQFELGGVVLDSLTVAFFEGAIGRQKLNVIGGDLLRRFNWVFTEDRKFVYLIKT